LLRQKRPRDIAIDLYKGKGSVESFHVEIVESYEGTFDPLSIKKFDDYWERCFEEVGKNSTVQFVWQESNELGVILKEAKKELVKRIEEPWRI